MAGEKMVVEWAKAKSDRRDDRFGGRYGGGGGGDRYGYGRNGYVKFFVILLILKNQKIDWVFCVVIIN